MNNILENAPKIVLNNLIKESYKKNTTILKQGDINEYLYFINKGIVDVWTVSKKGQEISLSTFITGQSIGIFEIFDSKLQTENVVALVDTDIIKIHKDFVLKWMKEDFEFTLYIIKIFQDCFNQASYFSRNLVTLKLKERVMLSLYNHHKNKTLSSLTKEKLLQETGAQKRSLNRSLEEIYKSQIIEYRNKQFCILDEKLLIETAKPLI